MEEKIKTCEEYVLAELAAWKRRAEAAESDRNAITMLRSIFTVEDAGGELALGVHEELLDPSKDSGAMARILLLKSLFGTDNAVGEPSEPSEPKASASAKGPVVSPDGTIAFEDFVKAFPGVGGFEGLAVSDAALDAALGVAFETTAGVAPGSDSISAPGSAPTPAKKPRGRKPKVK